MSQTEDLVAAYRILAEHGVIDAYGHVSVRSDRDPRRYLLARSLAPEMVMPEASWGTASKATRTIPGDGERCGSGSFTAESSRPVRTGKRSWQIIPPRSFRSA